MSEGNNKGDFPNVDRKTSERDMPGGDTPVQRWTCRNVLPGAAGTGTYCPERQQTGSGSDILLGVGAGAVYHNKLCDWLRSLRLCGQPGDDVGKQSRSGV